MRGEGRRAIAALESVFLARTLHASGGRMEQHPGDEPGVASIAPGQPSRMDLRAMTLPRVKPERKTNCSELSDKPQAPKISQPPMNEPTVWLAKMVSCR